MGCNSSQEKISCSSVDVQENLRSSGVSDKNGKNLKVSKQTKKRNNHNDKIGNNKLLVDEIEEFGQEEEDLAATKIQAAFRGHKTRTAMKKSENNKNCSKTAKTTSPPQQIAAVKIGNNAESSNDPTADNNQPTKAELEAEFDPNDKELCGAAMKIQATFRGHLQRKLNTASDKDEDVDIQEITKKVAEELDIDLTDPELNKAATKIQASFRGHKVRKQDQ